MRLRSTPKPSGTTQETARKGEEEKEEEDFPIGSCVWILLVFYFSQKNGGKAGGFHPCRFGNFWTRVESVAKWAKSMYRLINGSNNLHIVISTIAIWNPWNGNGEVKQTFVLFQCFYWVYSFNLHYFCCYFIFFPIYIIFNLENCAFSALVWLNLCVCLKFSQKIRFRCGDSGINIPIFL